MASGPGDFRTLHSPANKTANPDGSRPHAFTRRGREFAQRLVESEQYRKWLHDRIANQTLDASLERMLWAYAYGKPKETIELSTRAAGLADAPVDVLHAHAEKLAVLLIRLKSATTKDEADALMASLAELEDSSPAVH